MENYDLYNVSLEGEKVICSFCHLNDKANKCNFFLFAFLLVTMQYFVYLRSYKLRGAND